MEIIRQSVFCSVKDAYWTVNTFSDAFSSRLRYSVHTVLRANRLAVGLHNSAD